MNNECIIRNLSRTTFHRMGKYITQSRWLFRYNSGQNFFSLFNRYDSEVGFPFNLIINIFSITTTDSVILKIFNLNEKC